MKKYSLSCVLLLSVLFSTFTFAQTPTPTPTRTPTPIPTPTGLPAWIIPGEKVTAEIVNRPLRQVFASYTSEHNFLTGTHKFSSAQPTALPTATPVSFPTALPTATPVSFPTALPTATPVSFPTPLPTATPHGTTVAACEPSAADGRLTLTSGTPVTTADVTAATTLYYVPFEGNRIALYNGSNWVGYSFTERSLSLSGGSANQISDIFIYDNSGTLTLERVDWNTDTARMTELAYQDGIPVRSGYVTHRYLGTIRTTNTTGQTEDSTSNRFVWNAYKRRERMVSYTDSTVSWTYASQTWRQLRGQTGAHVRCVTGLAEDVATVVLGIYAENSAYIGIGVNSTTTPTITIIGAGGGVFSSAGIIYQGVLPIGLATLYPLERAGSGQTASYHGSNDSQSTMYFQGRVKQ